MVKSSLKDGHKISNATVFLQQDELEWSVNLDVELMAFKGLKCPAVTVERGEESELDGAFLEKMYLIGKADELLNDTFVEFLKVRLSDSWSSQLNFIHNWHNSLD